MPHDFIQRSCLSQSMLSPVPSMSSFIYELCEELTHTVVHEIQTIFLACYRKPRPNVMNCGCLDLMPRIIMSGRSHVPLVRCRAINIVTDRYGSSEPPIKFSLRQQRTRRCLLKHQKQRGPLYVVLCFVVPCILECHRADIQVAQPVGLKQQHI